MNIHIPKVKIHLATFEVYALHKYFVFLAQRSHNNLKKMDNDQIVLLEYAAKIGKLKVSTEYRVEPKKGFVVTFPLSVARILHARLQEGSFNEIMIMILGKIDYSLNSLNVEPEVRRTLKI